MAEILTPLPSLFFPHEADTLSFRRAASAETSLALSIVVDGRDVLRTTLSFDSAGECLVEDLAPLLSDFARTDGGAAAVTVAWDGGSSSGMMLPCRVFLAEGAEEFCRRSFLSLLSGTKHTTLLDTERLSFFPPGSAELTADATLRLSYFDGEGLTEQVAGLRVERTDALLPFVLALRPADYQAEEGPRLVSLSVTAGERVQEMEVAEAPYGSEAVEIVNGFGCTETLRLWEVEREAKPVRSAASFAGRYRNYRVVEQTTFKGTTAPLLDGELPLVDDAVHALSLRRASDGMELALTDAEWKHSSAATEMPRATLTFREAGRAAALKPTRPARTFDGTFDNTFD